ncbi:MAG: acetoacetate--CoA ligase [Gammaproteobacteria bacterium]|nr:acetoacetate--CoA ligase [Gammaproteobacteria bacterium]
MDAPIIWQPTPGQVADCQMTAFLQEVNRTHGVGLDDYPALWQWSVDQPALFWSMLWKYCNVIASAPASSVVERGEAMPGARWFVGARLNFAENLLRHRDAQAALIFRDESGGERRLDYAGLYRQAGAVAHQLQALGVGPGDRVAAIMPNVPEAVIGMLATAWLGAVWSSCSPDFGAQGIIDRFGQIEPKVLIVTDGYRFKGRLVDIRDTVTQVRSALPDDTRCILVSWQGCGALDDCLDWSALVAADLAPPAFAQVAFDAPLYILFSSGTTGKPKCIVHGVGGTLLQHLKEHRLHCDLRRSDRLFYYTTCGWMMWNWLVSGLASGATLVLFDGNPFHPEPDALWQMANELGVTLFGTSAKYLSAQEKAGVRVSDRLPLERLRMVLSTGSPLAPESFDYVLRDIRPGVQICSISGGTDIVSCFALGCPMLPVRRGQLQCRGLGLAVDVFDSDGRPLRNRPGELVCTRPFPCMPIGFWNDPGGSRYHAAYFERFPGIWTHGDFSILTDAGSLVIEGRSDAVLNPGGVRIGTAEIYRQVERLDAVRESVCIGQRWDNDVRVVLFVVLRDGRMLDEALRAQIRQMLRANASPRHVPARIIQIDDIPRTRSGKISELAVRDVVEGRVVANTESLLNPEALAQFRDRPELQS